MKYIILTLAPLISAGCSSMMRHDSNYSNLEPSPYCGFLDDCETVYRGISSNGLELSDAVEDGPVANILVRTVLVAFATVDAPLSFCVDTIYLPSDINHAKNKDKKSNQRVEPTVKTSVD
jgi:uncharacterized protein YceK